MDPRRSEPLTDSTPFGRRRFLGLGGAATVGAGLLLVGCGSGSPTSGPTTTDDTVPADRSGTDTTVGATDDDAAASLTTGTPSSTVLTAADFAALGTCVVLPDLTAGPYPTVTQIERRDITEGLGGHPLRVGVQVVDESCTPVPGAVVEIWHCDVDGDYSAYTDGGTDDDAGPGTTFFRGSQTANHDGIVEFLTRYPGWYSGRAVHIHAKAHIDDTTVLTTQFFFDDAVNDEIFTEAPYAGHGEPDTTNRTDSIAGDDPQGDGLLLTVSDDTAIAGSRALIVVGLDPTARSSGATGMGGPGGAGGGPPPRP